MIKFLDVHTVGEEATDFLYMLMAERMTEPNVNISAKRMPSYREHAEFVRGRPYRYWFIVAKMGDGEFPDEWVGYVSATHSNEIGIVLLKKFRRQGIGKLALEKLMADHVPLAAEPSKRHGGWVANINPANEASINLFTKLGFQLSHQTYTRGG